MDKQQAKEYALDCQRSADYWVSEYANCESSRWQAEWAVNRANDAWDAVDEIQGN